MLPKPEYWLSLDLSSPIGSVAIHKSALGEPPNLQSLRFVGPEFKHSEQVLPVLLQVLEQANISFERIDKFITTSGPGSFTGLRIAFIALKAFAYARGKPIEIVNASEARARAWCRTQSDLKIPSQITVCTYGSASKLILADFEFREKGDLHFVQERVTDHLIRASSDSPTFLLVDERTENLQLPGPFYSKFLFPLNARHLAETLLEATTRKTYSELEQWIPLSPEYF